MVQIVDNQCDILAHINIDIVWSGQKLWCLIYQVGSQDAVNQAILLVLVELVQAVGEQTEGCTYEYLSCFSSL